MKCPVCGAENADNAIFCNQCNTWILSKRFEEAVPHDTAVSLDRTRCPVCGAENERNAIYCSQCDSWILGEKYQDPLPPAAPVEEPTPEPQPTKKQNRRRWLKFGVPGGVILLIAFLLAILLPRGKEANKVQNFAAVPYVKHIQPYTYSGRLQILSDDHALNADFSTGNYKSYATSLDGSVAALLTNGGTLYYVHNDVVHSIGSYVDDFRLSTSGNGLLYAQRGTAYLYHMSKDTTVELPLSENMTVLDFALSPDGQFAALTIQDSMMRMTVLMRYRLGDDQLKSMDTITDTSRLISISDRGCIYLNVQTKLYGYDTDGTSTPLGTHYNSISEPFYLNADQDQLIYWSFGGTYLSENGKESRRICELKVCPLWPERPKTSRTNICEFTPLYDFHGQYFTTDPKLFLGGLPTEGRAWRLIEGTCQQISDAHINPSSQWVDESCRYLYYLSQNNTLYRYDSSTKKETEVAENVLQYVVSRDRNTIYYTTFHQVYRCNGDGGNVEMIYDGECDGLYIAGNDRLYFTNLFMLYAYDGKSHCEVVNAQLQRVSSTPNGYLYVYTRSEVFVITPESQQIQLLPKKLQTVPAI